MVLSGPRPATGQGIVVDQGRFDVSLNGRNAGTEEFTIRRTGIGRDDAIFANAVVVLNRDGGQEIHPVLRATPPDGVVTCSPNLTVCYQVEVTGPEALELLLSKSRAGRRYVAVINSELGEEHREFPALAGTRVLERDVAHLYYFLRDAREGSIIPVLEPRSRARLSLETGAWTDEELRVGPGVVLARRVEFSAGEDRRTVWFDRLGRVLRVSIPAQGYVAERTDLLR